MFFVLTVQRRSGTEWTEGGKLALAVDTNNDGYYNDIIKNNNILTPKYLGETLDTEHRIWQHTQQQ